MDSSAYVDAIARVIGEQGRIRAAQQLQSGQIWSQLISNLGQTVAGIPGQMQQMKAAQQEGQIRDLQIQKALDDRKAQQAMDAAFAGAYKPDASGKMTLDENELFKHLPGHMVPGVMENVAKVKKAQADLAETQNKVTEGQNDLIAGLLNGVKASGYDPKVFLQATRTAQHSQLISPEQATQYALGAVEQGQPFVQQTTDDLLGRSQAWQKIQTERMTAQSRVMAAQKPTEATIALESVGGDPSAAIERLKPTKEAAQKSLQAENKLVDGKPASVFFDPDPSAAVHYYDAEMKPIENAASRVKPMPPASVVYPKPEASAAPAPEIKPGTPEYKVAQDLAAGKLTSQQFRSLTAYGRDTGKKMAIYAKAAELNPEFNQAQFELGFKMASNPQIRQRIVAINSLEPVIDKVDQLADQVGNGDIPVWNRFINSAKFNIGDKTVTNFRQMQILLGDEVGNALGVGTGSDLKTKLGLDLVNPNLSAANFKSTMAQLRSVLEARRSELLRQMGMYGDVAAPPTSKKNPFVK